MVFYEELYSSPVGVLSLVAEENQLRGIWFRGQKHEKAGLIEPVLAGSCPVLEQTMTYLDAYFAGERDGAINLPLKIVGTDFQQLVWQALQDIPYGQTVTYGQLSHRLGIKSSQAVGGAVGRNPFSILIPCHRVLGAKGQLTGYAGGLDKKIWLLRHEGLEL